MDIIEIKLQKLQVILENLKKATNRTYRRVILQNKLIETNKCYKNYGS